MKILPIIFNFITLSPFLPPTSSPHPKQNKTKNKNKKERNIILLTQPSIYSVLWLRALVFGQQISLSDMTAKSVIFSVQRSQLLQVN